MFYGLLELHGVIGTRYHGDDTHFAAIRFVVIHSDGVDRSPRESTRPETILVWWTDEQDRSLFQRKGKDDDATRRVKAVHRLRLPPVRIAFMYLVFEPSHLGGFRSYCLHIRSLARQFLPAAGQRQQTPAPHHQTNHPVLPSPPLPDHHTPPHHPQSYSQNLDPHLS